MPPRLRWKAQVNAEHMDPLIAAADASIFAIQGAIAAAQPFQPYNAGGAQHAVTNVTWPAGGAVTAYATTMQQHSEMVALADSIAPPVQIWTLNGAGQVVAVGGAPITVAEYATNLPHCGHCTVMLWALNLPLGAPTTGRYNQAVNLSYTLPAEAFDNLDLLARLLNGNVGGNAALINLKTFINTFIQTPSAQWVLQVGPAVFVGDAAITPAAPLGAFVLDWDTEAAPHPVDVNVQHFGRNSLLVTLWKIVWKGIYDNVQ